MGETLTQVVPFTEFMRDTEGIPGDMNETPVYLTDRKPTISPTPEKAEVDAAGRIVVTDLQYFYTLRVYLSRRLVNNFVDQM